jgi:hypothetical protein
MATPSNINLDGLFKKAAVQPEIAQRTDLERFAVCPHMAQLIKEHGIEASGKLLESGVISHGLVKEAFEFSEGDIDGMADYVLNELPKTRPDLQPEILKGARRLAESLTRMPLNRLIGVEYVVDYPPREKDGSVKNPPAWLVKPNGTPIVLMTALDMLFRGNANNLIVQDHKTGYKRRTNEEAEYDFQTCYGTWLLFQLFQDIETIQWFYNETRWGTTAYAEFHRSKLDQYMPNLTTEMKLQARIQEVVRLWLMDCDEAWPLREKCVNCDAIKYCKFANEEALDFAQDPKAYVDAFNVRSALVDKMDDVLKEHVRQHGEVEGTSCVYKFVPPTSKFMPKCWPKESEVQAPRKKRTPKTKGE